MTKSIKYVLCLILLHHFFIFGQDTNSDINSNAKSAADVTNEPELLLRAKKESLFNSNLNYSQCEVRKFRSTSAVWFGVSMMFMTGEYKNYVVTPSASYELGMSKNVLKLSQHTHLYTGIMTEFLNSVKGVEGADLNLTYNSYVYRNNLSVVGGLDVRLNEGGFSFFIEAGPSYQHRSFVISDLNNTLYDYQVSNAVGMTAGLGFKLIHYVSPEFAFLIRARLSTSFGQTLNTPPLTFSGTGKKVDTNSLSWGPGVSLGAVF